VTPGARRKFVHSRTNHIAHKNLALSTSLAAAKVALGRILAYRFGLLHIGRTGLAELLDLVGQRG
jgi:hypothetical protein